MQQELYWLWQIVPINVGSKLFELWHRGAIYYLLWQTGYSSGVCETNGSTKLAFLRFPGRWKPCTMVEQCPRGQNAKMPTQGGGLFTTRGGDHLNCGQLKEVVQQFQNSKKISAKECGTRQH